MHTQNTLLVSLCLSHAVLAGTISEVSLIVLNYALLCSLLFLCSPPPLLLCLLLRYLLSVLSQNKDASRQFALQKSKEMPEAQRQKERQKERKRLVFKIYTFLCLCFELEQENFPKTVFCCCLTKTWVWCVQGCTYSALLITLAKVVKCVFIGVCVCVHVTIISRLL